MNYLKDLELINKIKKTSDSSALKELESRHTGIYNEIVKKYYKYIVDIGLNPSDIINDKLFILYKSALSFNPDKNVKFSTWLGNQARYHCLNCLNKKNNLITMENKDIKNIIEKKQTINDLNHTNLLEKSDLIISILDRLKDKRISRIYKMRYFDGAKLTPWNKISKKLKISTQTAINLHEKGRKLLKNKLTKNLESDII